MPVLPRMLIRRSLEGIVIWESLVFEADLAGKEDNEGDDGDGDEPKDAVLEKVLEDAEL